MTRKNYVSLAMSVRVITSGARELADKQANSESLSAEDKVDAMRMHGNVLEMVEVIMDALRQDNPRFSREMFLTACDLPTGE